MDHQMIAKALNTTNGASLIPEVVNPAVREYIAKEPLLLNAVTHLPWATPAYYIRKRTAIPTASWGADGAALPAAQQSTYSKVSKSVAYVYARGEVTGPMQKAAGSLYDAMALEVEAQGRALSETLSAAIATGDGTADDIEGMLYQISTSATMNAGSGELDKTGQVLTLEMIDEAIDNSRGEVDMMVTSRAVRRKINSLLSARQRFNDRVEIQAGFRVLAYDEMPIVTDLNWEDNTEILFVKRADAKFLVHQDVEFEQLAKTKDSTDFLLKSYVGFALEGRPTRLKDFTLA